MKGLSLAPPAPLAPQPPHHAAFVGHAWFPEGPRPTPRSFFTVTEPQALGAQAPSGVGGGRWWLEDPPPMQAQSPARTVSPASEHPSPWVYCFLIKLDGKIKQN